MHGIQQHNISIRKLESLKLVDDALVISYLCTEKYCERNVFNMIRVQSFAAAEY